MDKMEQIKIVGFVGIGFLLAMYLGQRVIASLIINFLHILR
jgi:hypothetical protein